MGIITLADKKFVLYITADKIQAGVQRIADRINADLNKEDVVFLGILNGAFMFASDLVRKISFDVRVTFVKLTSYNGDSSSGSVKQLIGVNDDLKDKTVVIVEDIIDTGNTIESIVAQVKAFMPGKIFVAALLLKPDMYSKEINVDYVGFRIPSNFVAGYGLDYNGFGRNLPDLYSLEE